MAFPKKLVAATGLLATANAHRFLQAGNPCAAENAACMGDSFSSGTMTDCFAILMSTQPTCPGTPDAGLACAMGMSDMVCTGPANNQACTSEADGTCDGGAGCVYTEGATVAEMQIACDANTECAASMTCSCAADPTCGGDLACPCPAAPAPGASSAARVAPVVMIAFAALFAN